MNRNNQPPERPCIKVTRVNGRGYEGARTRRERSAYAGWLALNQFVLAIVSMVKRKFVMQGRQLRQGFTG